MYKVTEIKDKHHFLGFSNINYCEQFHCSALPFSTTRPDEHYGDKFSFSMYIHTTKITILTSFEYIHTHIADIIVRILGPVDLGVN